MAFLARGASGGTGTGYHEIDADDNHQDRREAMAQVEPKGGGRILVACRDRLRGVICR